ncbi:hypothetical protein MIND_00002900 [Mycena indigotica]|uniref:Uncharacterized protein n=1 Tax=Mycena indigotica TaxID=2126181 RepID=A0A8H6TDS9_9AGAR|nr:uncharacterized protein MIND_00002900 [Mycena indigotica]KAF7314891.1 hypothetical protein MIND_00002900 [Mycena indigotica]
MESTVLQNLHNPVEVRALGKKHSSSFPISVNKAELYLAIMNKGMKETLQDFDSQVSGEDPRQEEAKSKRLAGSADEFIEVGVAFCLGRN